MGLTSLPPTWTMSTNILLFFFGGYPLIPVFIFISSKLPGLATSVTGGRARGSHRGDGTGARKVSLR